MAAGFNARLLELWDRGADLDVNRRAAQALELWDIAAGEAVYERDGRLVALREALFGPTMDGVVECPACRVAFDIEIDLSALPMSTAPPTPVEVHADGFALLARPPRADDVAALGETLDARAAAEELFRRCVVHAAQDGREITPREIPAPLRRLAAEEMASRGMESPFLDLVCGACGEAWRAPLDIARSLLGELDGSAASLLDDVHRIAAAYHWSEEAILDLPARRRRHYLEAIG